MATIHSLPPETLHRILELGSPWPINPEERPSESYAFLRHISLVSRACRAAAQERLWRNVVLCYEEDVQAFARSSVGDGRTTVMLAIGENPLEGDDLGRAIEACSGLRQVAIRRMTCWNVLCLPEMAGVTSLSLSLFEGSKPPPTTTLPFNLTHLELYDIPPAPLFDTLLQPTLTSLRLSLLWLERHHIPSLTSIAHQLTSLHLIFDIAVRKFTMLRPFLSACVCLVHFAVEPDYTTQCGDEDWTKSSPVRAYIGSRRYLTAWSGSIGGRTMQRPTSVCCCGSSGELRPSSRSPPFDSSDYS